MLSLFMNQHDSAISSRRPALPSSVAGPLWGLLGVAAFSLTLPLTRVAVGGLSPILLGAGRATIAALLAAALLLIVRPPLPRRSQWIRLAVVAAGIVVGFPFLASYALRSVPAAHGAIVVGLLPAATAVMAVVRGRERPPARFWVLSLLGAAAVVGFTAVQGGGFGGLHAADLLLFGAVLAGGVGYAEGGLLARALGAWQTVSWAVLLCGPAMALLAAAAWWQSPPHAAPTQWMAFAYLGVVSMFLGFFAWYRGLAIGPLATVSQVQLTQPIMSLGWAVLLLGEQVSPGTWFGGLGIIVLTAAAVNTRSLPRRLTPPPHPPADGHPAGTPADSSGVVGAGGRGSSAPDSPGCGSSDPDPDPDPDRSASADPGSPGFGSSDPDSPGCGSPGFGAGSSASSAPGADRSASADADAGTDDPNRPRPQR